MIKIKVCKNYACICSINKLRALYFFQIFIWINKHIKYTKITGVKLSPFVYRLFHEGFSPTLFRGLERNLRETVCKQIQIN